MKTIQIQKTPSGTTHQITNDRTRRESLERLKFLEEYVEDFVPSSACNLTIWGHLGWKPEFDAAYAVIKDYGLDLRPLLAPEFADIVAIVVDGEFNFPFPGLTFNWADILTGRVPFFNGENAKQRLLSLLRFTQRECLDS